MSSERSVRQVRGHEMGKAVAKSIGALDRRQLAVIDQLALDFEQAWKQGKLPRIEAFLRRPEVDPSIQGVLFDELLTLEMEYRVRRGETPDVAKYQARFPHLAERVEAVFDYVCPSILHRTSDHNSDNSREGVVFDGEVKCPAAGGLAESQVTRDDRPLPKHIGRYTILRLIAEGGFGRVMLAKDAELNRLVAVKVSHQGLFTGEHDVSRFLEEARMAAQLKHPSIVSIHDVGRDGELGCFIVMDFIDGGPLDVEDAAGRMSYSEVASLIAQIADAVHYAHTKGLVHRDLKPGNILLDNRGVPHVADFGLAVHESVQQDYAGEISGTPPYMSPEQVRGLTHRMDGRTDIWTLGVLLYELLAGRRPFAGQTRAKVFDEVLNRDPKPLRQINDAIPVDLECICLKALHKQPADRYSTALDLAESLRRAIANSPEGLLVTPPIPPPVRRTPGRRSTAIAVHLAEYRNGGDLDGGGGDVLGDLLRWESRTAKAAATNAARDSCGRRPGQCPSRRMQLGCPFADLQTGGGSRKVGNRAFVRGATAEVGARVPPRPADLRALSVARRGVAGGAVRG